MILSSPIMPNPQEDLVDLHAQLAKVLLIPQELVCSVILSVSVHFLSLKDLKYSLSS